MINLKDCLLLMQALKPVARVVVRSRACLHPGERYVGLVPVGGVRQGVGDVRDLVDGEVTYS